MIEFTCIWHTCVSCNSYTCIGDHWVIAEISKLPHPAHRVVIV